MHDYAAYIERIKANIKHGLNKEDAVDEALEFAIKNNMLNGFFQSQKLEVMNMSLTEFNQEEYDRNRYDEGKEAGILQKALETAKNFLKMGFPLEQVAKGTGLSIDQVKQLANA